MSNIKIDLPLNRIILSDSLKEMERFDNASIDLIITSPPYADQRKNTYGGIHPDKYVDWFRPFTKEMYRILKPEGSFVLNIKEKVVNGQRHRYVHKIIDMMIDEQEWLWTEEYIWHKKNCFPGKWPNRFRDAWEHCHHFNKQKKFAMYQDDVMVPIGDWAIPRLANLSETDKIRDASKSGSSFGKNVSKWVKRDKVYPTNVLHFATECGNTGHSAAFPEELPEFFIKLLSKQGDIVLDPFVGSGTTAAVARDLSRNFIGIDSDPTSFHTANQRLSPPLRKNLIRIEPTI